MTIREKLEERERQTLSPMASLSAESRGRQFPAESHLKTAFAVSVPGDTH